VLKLSLVKLSQRLEWLRKAGVLILESDRAALRQ
jgi:hypothetical protein